MNADAKRPLIAHVVYRFDVGGLENGVVNLINRLDRYDHAVIALTEVTDFCKRITRERTVFHALAKPPGHGLAIYRSLYRLFRQLQPTIVHTRNIAASEAQLPAAVAGVPIRVHGEHGWELRDVEGGKRSHHLQRRLLAPLIHRHVALSGEIRRYLEERVGIAPARITQICNGVDVERFTPSSRPADDAFVVGTVGRLSPVKHQRLLVDAFALACRTLRGVDPALAGRMRLLIAGDGPDRPALEARVAATDVAAQIELAGARNDVPAVLARLDLFVLPSLAEGISNTILEAMASGLPVIATAVGGNHELVDDDITGRLVPSDDVDAMSTAIVAYATSPDRARHHGAAGRARAVDRFSIDAMVSGYAELYDALLATRPGVRRSASAMAALPS